MRKRWLSIGESVKHPLEKYLVYDMMSGKISDEEVAQLISEVEKNNLLRYKKIAVFLNEPESYNYRFFDSAVKYSEFSIKHFTNISEAKEWLVEYCEC